MSSTGGSIYGNTAGEMKRQIAELKRALIVANSEIKQLQSYLKILSTTYYISDTDGNEVTFQS
jgi:hypothetical protein